MSQKLNSSHYYLANILNCPKRKSSPSKKLTNIAYFSSFQRLHVQQKNIDNCKIIKRQKSPQNAIQNNDFKNLRQQENLELYDNQISQKVNGQIYKSIDDSKIILQNQFRQQPINFTVKIRYINQIIEVKNQSIFIKDFIQKIKLELSKNKYSIQQIIGFKINPNCLPNYQNTIDNINYVLSLKQYLIPKQLIEIFLNNNIELFPIFKDSDIKQNKLNNYQIIKFLGSGGFSQVYLCRNSQNNVHYALKFIMKQQLDHHLDPHKQLIRNQQNILKALQHRSICKLYQSFETNNFYVLVLQYCPGGELFQLLQQLQKQDTKLSLQQIKFYILQVLQVLEYLHSNDIIYRDIKPQNILIDQYGFIKIADFGLAKVLSSDNREKVAYSFCGSPEYMSPQMLEQSGHTFMVDYYCLGALAYELYYGAPPFYSLDQQKIYQSILGSDIVFPKDPPQDFKDFLLNLLIKDPNKRLGHNGIQQIYNHKFIKVEQNRKYRQVNQKPSYIPNLISESEQTLNSNKKFQELIQQEIKIQNIDKYQQQLDIFNQKNINQFNKSKLKENQIKIQCCKKFLQKTSRNILQKQFLKKIIHLTNSIYYKKQQQKL